MKIGDTNDEDIRAQLAEYHVTVSEVIGGMTADIIETKKKLDELQSKYDSISKTIIMLQESNRMLIKEILKNKNIENEVLKAIAGFLNSEGGQLFVGVNDSGEITGLDWEINKFHKFSHSLKGKGYSMQEIGKMYREKIEKKK